MYSLQSIIYCFLHCCIKELYFLSILSRKRERTLSFILFCSCLRRTLYFKSDTCLFREEDSSVRCYNVAGNNIFHPVLEHMVDTFIRSGVKDAIGENGIKGRRARRSGMI